MIGVYKLLIKNYPEYIKKLKVYLMTINPEKIII